jgi:hypothetical protein
MAPNRSGVPRSPSFVRPATTRAKVRGHPPSDLTDMGHLLPAQRPISIHPSRSSSSFVCHEPSGAMSKSNLEILSLDPPVHAPKRFLQVDVPKRASVGASPEDPDGDRIDRAQDLKDAVIVPRSDLGPWVGSPPRPAALRRHEWVPDARNTARKSPRPRPPERGRSAAAVRRQTSRISMMSLCAKPMFANGSELLFFASGCRILPRVRHRRTARPPTTALILRSRFARVQKHPIPMAHPHDMNADRASRAPVVRVGRINDYAGGSPGNPRKSARAEVPSPSPSGGEGRLRGGRRRVNASFPPMLCRFPAAGRCNFGGKPDELRRRCSA